MVQVNGMRADVDRFSSERTGRVKYSTLWLSRSDSPSAASRAIPTSLGSSESGSRGREAMAGILYSPFIRLGYCRADSLSRPVYEQAGLRTVRTGLRTRNTTKRAATNRH